MNFGIIPIVHASVASLVSSIDKVIVNPLIFLLFAVALILFLYGIVKLLLSPDNEEVRKTSKSHIMWGLFGMFIMVSVFAIMNIILNTLGVSNITVQTNGTISIKK